MLNKGQNSDGKALLWGVIRAGTLESDLIEGLDPPITGCVTLGKSLALSEPYFPYLLFIYKYLFILFFINIIFNNYNKYKFYSFIVLFIIRG